MYVRRWVLYLAEMIDSCITKPLRHKVLGNRGV